MIYVISCYEIVDPQNTWAVAYTPNKTTAKEAVWSLKEGNPRFHYWFEKLEEYS